MRLTATERVRFSFDTLRRAPATRWFVLAAGLLLLFVLYTYLLTTGIFNASTAQVEQWLLGRPITRVDCLFYEWRNLGDALLIVALTGVVGIVCFRLGYQWSVVPYLLLLLFVSLVVEGLGKILLTQPIPHAVSAGMSALNCPQLHGQPASVRLSAATGMWWNIPPASEQLIERIHLLSQQPFFSEWYYMAASYPGGHAMRCSFLGVLVCWLCWRHVKHLVLRAPLMLLALLVAFGVGFIQFYIGAHLITDTIAGYLFGLAAGCCAIGVLLLHAPQQQTASP